MIIFNASSAQQLAAQQQQRLAEIITEQYMSGVAEELKDEARPSCGKCETCKCQKKADQSA